MGIWGGASTIKIPGGLVIAKGYEEGTNTHTETGVLSSVLLIAIDFSQKKLR